MIQHHADNSKGMEKTLCRGDFQTSFLEDKRNAGKIDERKKSEWLLGRIGADENFDDNEKLFLLTSNRLQKRFIPS